MAAYQEHGTWNMKEVFPDDWGSYRRYEIGQAYRKAPHQQPTKLNINIPGFPTPTMKHELWATTIESHFPEGSDGPEVTPGFHTEALPYYVEGIHSRVRDAETYEEYPILCITGRRIPVYFHSVSATAKSAERATLSRRRRPRFPAGGATALWPPALPRAAAQGALDRGVVEVRGPDLNLQRRGALGVPGRDRPARDLPSAELREPDRHRDVLCAERGQPPRGVRGPHDCPLSGSPSPSAASASRSFMR